MKQFAWRQGWVGVALLGWVSAASANVRDASGVVQVVVDAPSDSVTVGQRFPVAYRVTAPDSLAPILRTSVDAGKCRVVSFAWQETKREGTTERVANVVMVPVALDSVAVPPNSFDFVSPNGDTLRAWSDGFDVPLHRIALTSEDLRPLKSQWEVAPDYLKWALIAAGVLALAAAVIWWVRRRRARVVVEAPKIVVPPHVIALAELDRIAQLGLVERGEMKSYYTMVTDALRRYVDARYDVEAMDRTTYEVVDELSRRSISVDGLERLLNEADLVKFAKLKPDAPAAHAAIEAARTIVVSTTPRDPDTVAATVGTAT